ncbi:arylesterase [Aestuariibacter sp. P117]|uniref:Arylesterase n=1 Tax=Glaciecola petra TaxID=3075602 RepID=A0ABU2ZRE4_9ALTE|nr:arylesterase [Aestuariibacter sp. P117]MDT0594608.1 arylesterase [Aestuariibacter sp. P117]
MSLLFATLVHSDQSVSAENVTSEYKLLVLGDSLSAAYGLTAEQGWVYLLAEKWQAQSLPIKVVNAAISGDTTDGGLARLPRLIELHQPTHLYIELGGNNALQGHNPRKIKQNLMNMVETAENSNIKVIIQEMQIPTNYGARYTKAFTSIFHEIAEEKDIPLIPFFLQEIALTPGLMQRDGIHPTKEAQPMIVEFLADKLASAVDARLLTD